MAVCTAIHGVVVAVSRIPKQEATVGPNTGMNSLTPETTAKTEA